MSANSAHTTDSMRSEVRRRIDVLVGQYAESHRHPTNVLVHWFCVPIIVWCSLALLFVLHPWACYAASLAALVYYARLSWTMATLMALFTVVSISSFFVMPYLGWVAVSAFVVAWVAQFIGHEVEGKKPSFFQDLQFLLVGPLFLLVKAFRKANMSY